MTARTRNATLSHPVADADVSSVRRLVERVMSTTFFKERRAANVCQPPPAFSRERFWYVVIGCLLTTQQRSTRNSPVDRFMNQPSFPVSVELCQCQDIESFMLECLKEFGGIRRGVTIARQAGHNWRQLYDAQWAEAEKWFDRLLAQRSREPQEGDFKLEREAANWADRNFAGLGPKQSRNLWQWLGMTRYEIPLDSRVTNWVNTNLTGKIEPKRLNDLRYYESVLDYLQGICHKADVLPCELDAAAFDYEDLGFGSTKEPTTTEPGFVNLNGQVTIRNTGLPGTDHNQYVYQIACSHCGETYGANGTDIFERKCPRCQQGKAGISLGS
jgi:hypothetical protein